MFIYSFCFLKSLVSDTFSSNSILGLKADKELVPSHSPHTIEPLYLAMPHNTLCFYLVHALEILDYRLVYDIIYCIYHSPGLIVYINVGNGHGIGQVLCQLDFVLSEHLLFHIAGHARCYMFNIAGLHIHIYIMFY